MQNAYREAFGTVERVASKAKPEVRADAVVGLLAEIAAGIHRGDMTKAEFADEAYGALHRSGMVEAHGDDYVQNLMTMAIDRAPRPAASNGSGDGLSATTVRLKGTASTSTLVVARMSDIAPQLIRWLWPGRIAIGKQTILAGEPGLGKSQLTAFATALVTRGGTWPDGSGEAAKGSVVILSAEDDAADTIRPRLDAAEADVSRVHVISAVAEPDGKGRRAFNLQADLALLEQLIRRVGDVRLVIIDPVSSYLGKVDSHKNAELRAVLEPIGDMASRMGVAVLSVTHLNKGSGGSANNRVIGSIAFVAAARAAFIIARDPDNKDRRLFIPTKNNLGPEGTGLGFTIQTVQTPSGIIAPRVQFDTTPVTMTASEALEGSASAFNNREAPSRTEAEDFLRELLREGAMAVKEIEREAKAAGIAWRTVRRAKDEIGVRAVKAGLDGGWVWEVRP